MINARSRHDLVVVGSKRTSEARSALGLAPGSGMYRAEGSLNEDDPYQQTP